MKKLKLIPILAMVFMLTTASTCSSDDDSPSTSTVSGTNPTQVTNNVTTGTWRVSLYKENETVKTSDFNGYIFTFDVDDALYATNGTTTNNADWSTYTDSGATKLSIAFDVADGSFESISEDWDVLTSTATAITLKHVSGGDGSIDLLTFEKI